MENYKECSEDSFNIAMSMKDSPVSSIPDKFLYILYTKYCHDTFAVGTGYMNSYISGILIDTKRKRDSYKEELVKRGFIL